MLAREGRRNGCHDHAPFAETVLVQDGWTADGRRIMVEKPYAFDRDGPCPYSFTKEGKADPGCIACIHFAKTGVACPK